MKIIILFFILIFLFGKVSAIIISEVELNPEGNDIGYEWIEFYSEKEINMSEYKIVNNDGDEIILNTSFQGIFIFTFEKQWLDNSDEKIYLYKDNELIDETPILKDSKNNNFTWQFCEEWKFLESSKNQICDKIKGNIQKQNEENKTEEANYNNYKKEGVIKKKENITDKIYKSNNTRKIIKASQNIKSKENNKFLNKSIYAKYGLIAFCFLLLILFIKNKKRYKNEFT